ncbi:MAG: hypothetical protein AAGA31_01510, partial [Bacteroidota bacterium]
MLSRTLFLLFLFLCIGFLRGQVLPITRGEVSFSSESVILDKELKVYDGDLFVPSWHWVDPERDTIVELNTGRLPFGSLPTASIGHHLAFNTGHIASPEGWILLDTVYSESEIIYSPRRLGNTFVYLSIATEPPFSHRLTFFDPVSGEIRQDTVLVEAADFQFENDSPFFTLGDTLYFHIPTYDNSTGTRFFRYSVETGIQEIGQVGKGIQSVIGGLGGKV